MNLDKSLEASEDSTKSIWHFGEYFLSWLTAFLNKD